MPIFNSNKALTKQPVKLMSFKQGSESKRQQMISVSRWGLPYNSRFVSTGHETCVRNLTSLHPKIGPRKAIPVAALLYLSANPDRAAQGWLVRSNNGM